jgi:hypothetical protein
MKRLGCPFLVFAVTLGVDQFAADGSGCNVLEEIK